MDEFIPYYRLSELIAKYLSSDINDAEHKELEEWIAKSEANQALFADIIKSQSFEEWQKMLATIDPEKKWLEIEKRILTKENNGRKWNFSPILQYAAIIIFVILGGFWALNYFNPSTDTRMVIKEPQAMQNIDSSKVILQLASGELINIDAEKEQQVLNNEQISVNISKGNKIEYVPKNETSKEAPLNQIFVPFGKVLRIVLSDGTNVQLNSGSKFTYPVFFSGAKREVTLNGEGYFEVAENKSSPFEINTGALTYRVLGTTFNINSFLNEPETEAVLVTGSLGVYKTGSVYSDNSVVKIKPNEKIAYTAETNTLRIETVNAHNYISWINGLFVFRNETFSQISRRLERTYDVEISCDYPLLLKERFIGQFNNETIEDIMESFKINRTFNYKMNGRKIMITR